MNEISRILYDREKGEALILRAERINKQDIIGALREDDFNMVIRRAQESVELTLESALKIPGIEYPKVYDVNNIFIQ